MKRKIYPWDREPNRWVGVPNDIVLFVPTVIGGEYEHITKPQEILEIVDVFVDCPKTISRVRVDLYDAGLDRLLASLTGPWLRQREVALVDLLAIVYDNVENKRGDALTAMARALEQSGGLVKPIAVGPLKTLRTSYSFYGEGATGADEAKIYFRTICWALKQ